LFLFFGYYYYYFIFAAWKVLLFKKLDINEGSSFDIDSGVFTAPRKGLYHFELLANTKSADGYVGKKIDHIISIVDYPAMAVRAKGGRQQTSDSISTISVMLELDKSSKVAAAFRGGIDGASSSIGQGNTDNKAGHSNCEFSGFLVTAIDD
jgi:hypothetical protein